MTKIGDIRLGGWMVPIGWATVEQLTPDLKDMLDLEHEARELYAGVLPMDAFPLQVADGMVLEVVGMAENGPAAMAEARELPSHSESPLGSKRLGRQLVHWTTAERLSEEMLGRYGPLQLRETQEGRDPTGKWKFTVIRLESFIDILVVMDEAHGVDLAKRWAAGWRHPGWTSNFGP